MSERFKKVLSGVLMLVYLGFISYDPRYAAVGAMGGLLAVMVYWDYKWLTHKCNCAEGIGDECNESD